MTEHPMQPIYLDERGIARFKGNSIIVAMLRWGKTGTHFDLNTIAREQFPAEDMEQLMQLIGYSVDGFGELSFVSSDSVIIADAAADELRKRP